MPSYLYAIHEFDPKWASILVAEGRNGWTVTTHALGMNPNDHSGFGDFQQMMRMGITPVARLNNGYEPVGTIPSPELYEPFAQRCANFVAASPGCTRWIIGNEPNLKVERPYGQTITPEQYAQCYMLCRRAIKKVGAHHEVIVAPVGPWNIESGDWIAYQTAVLRWLEAHEGADAIGGHTYTRSDNPYAIVSDEKMSAEGYTDRYANFRAYRDIMAAIIPSMRHLPVYFTEATVLPGWTNANTGVVQAMYAEIDRWNDTAGTQKIQFLALYRWPREDHWYIDGKAGVLEDFRAAAKVGYPSPAPGMGGAVPPTPPPPVNPPAEQPAEPPSEPPLFQPDIDPRATARGVTVTYARPKPGQAYWRVTRVRWLDVQEAIRVGPDHHILGDTLNQGVRQANIHLMVRWPDGTAPVVSKSNPGYPWSYDFAMSESLNEFSVEVNEGIPTDVVSGIGMGKDGNSAEHTSTVADWEYVVAPLSEPAKPQPPTPETPPQPPDKFVVPMLVHPVTDPNLRLMSQLWGENPLYYRRFVVDGVPLHGHNGIDFATPIGSSVRAVRPGTVAEAANDPSGWGNYVKIIHAPWGETLYAHLDTIMVKVGDAVVAGQQIGTSGNTGVSSGPHLHFGIRVNPYNRADGWGGYSDPGIYLRNTGTPIVPGVPVPPAAQGVIDPIVAAAIMDVETRGELAGPGGRMVIRFEPHIFHGKVPANVFDRHFCVGKPAWKGEYHQFRDPKDGVWKSFHGNQELEYRALELAKALNREAAYDATAMGAGQVMGFNAERVGYPSAEKMFAVLSGSKAAQVMAVANFIISDKQLFEAVKARDFEKAAELYNGSGQIEVYAGLMRDAYTKLTAA